MTTFFDTSALIAATKPGDAFHDWSKKQLETAERPIVIVDIVYAEFSVSMDTVEKVDAAVTGLELDRHPGGGDHALFQAGKVYHKFKKENDGEKTSLLPDFLIGAAADVEGATLVTSNARDYMSYFPNLKLVLPPELEAKMAAKAAVRAQNEANRKAKGKSANPKP